MIRLTDEEERHVGFLLGTAIDDHGLLKHGAQIKLPRSATEADSGFSDWLSTIRGRYVSFIDSPNVARFDLDPLGALAAVYSLDHPVIASTWSLIKNPSDEYLRAALKDPICTLACQSYPAGLTRTDDVARLLPNFALHTNTWRVQRHWPRPTDFEKTDDPNKELQRASNEIRHIIDSLAEHYDIYLTLTGGLDSRLIAACTSKKALKRTQFVTFKYDDKLGDRIDCHISKLIAKKLGRPQTVINIEPASTQDSIDYLRRIGVSGGAGKASDFMNGAKKLNPQRAFITGFSNTIRSIYGHYGSNQFERVEDSYDAAKLLQRCELEGNARSKRAISEWREGLKDYPIEMIPFLLYNEIRGGCWSSPHQYGITKFAATVIAFSSRPLERACIRLTKKALEDNNPGIIANATEEIIKMNQPKLAEISFNDFNGTRKLVRRLTYNRFWRIGK